MRTTELFLGFVASSPIILLVAAQSAQELINSVLNPPPGSEHYSSYSSEIYYNHTLYNQTPIASTNYDRLEASAKLLLPAPAYDYAAGGAGLEKTVASNRAAFDKWQIAPRVMRPVQPRRDLSITLFNRTLPAPIVMAPVGVQTLFHSTGERATSKVFGELGLPYTLSTASSTGFSDVAASNGAGNPRWYQLYWPSDDDLTRSYLETAKANGYEVLVVTVDTWDLGWRTRDLDRGFFPFIEGVGVQIGLEDPVAHEKLGFNPLASNATMEQKQMAALYHTITTSRGISPVWENLWKLREVWGDSPILLKGVQSAEDAKLASQWGLNGVIVSNHGGRQIDGAIASLDALTSIVEAVNGSMPVGFDGGIRSGADIFKALALGADFVQLGRPILWGLAHEGEKGVRHVLKSLLAELEITVGLAGCSDLGQVNKDLVTANI
ncbi:FMN-dependent alpha-hydroxy acid dehydrogenase [Lophiostoma macrostomum CBS 122681]|uniref:FMN-dependent alpha-hydroxy acid dehydrogenase n=1 Tax=Lophiostoma macrostomum CBS 122681 TaxID=1314788 RepID=A0A6A6T7S4_9PLEO|nr:FMN-dependent alpha-hydroxy acid dehydrogenase [Lophiostoma macrostomum CBS 122681]